MRHGPSAIDLPLPSYSQREAEFMVDSAVTQAKRMERERCARIVRDLAVIVGSSSRAFEEAISRITRGR